MRFVVLLYEIDRMGIKVEMLSQGASKVNISLVIPMKDKDRLIKALHAAFFEGEIISSGAYHDKN
jgi:aspartate kinase